MLASYIVAAFVSRFSVSAVNTEPYDGYKLEISLLKKKIFWLKNFKPKIILLLSF